MHKVLKITNKYIILATVLILYSLITNIYAVCFASAKTNIAGIIIAVLVLILMSGAFFAGWFKMIKDIVLEPEKDNSNSIIKVFPEGVGEYFLPALGGILLTSAIFGIVGAATFYFGLHFIGNPHIDWTKITSISNNITAQKEYLSSLSSTQLAQILQWNQLFIITVTTSYFLLFLYLPVLFFKTKNPFKAIWICLKDLFSKKILMTSGVFFLIFFANLIVSVFSALTMGNTIANFIATLLGFYILTASAVGLFEYYNSKFMQSHLGQNIDIKI